MFPDREMIFWGVNLHIKMAAKNVIIQMYKSGISLFVVVIFNRKFVNITPRLDTN